MLNILEKKRESSTQSRTASSTWQGNISTDDGSNIRNQLSVGVDFKDSIWYSNMVFKILIVIGFFFPSHGNSPDLIARSESLNKSVSVPFSENLLNFYKLHDKIYNICKTVGWISVLNNNSSERQELKKKRA